MQFEFTTWAGDTKYTALEVTSGDFFIYLNEQSPSEGSYWKKDEVNSNLISGSWKKVEEKKQPTFSIKKGSVESTARFIVANNNYQPYYNINECVERIKRCIARMIKRIKNGEEAYRCSTGGWTILIDKEDEDYYVVEVLVDTLVSQDREFVNVEDVL